MIDDHARTLGFVTGVMPSGDGHIRLTIEPAEGVYCLDLLGKKLRLEGTCEASEPDERGVRRVDHIVDVHSIHLVDEDAG